MKCEDCVNFIEKDENFVPTVVKCKPPGSTARVYWWAYLPKEAEKCFEFKEKEKELKK